MTRPDVLSSASPVREREQLFRFLVGALGGTVLIVVFLDNALGSVTSKFPALTVWLTFLILVSLGIMAALRVSAGQEHSWISPASMTLLYYAFKFGWGALVVYYWADLPWMEFPEIRDIFSDIGAERNLPFACKMIVLGGIGLSCGFWISSGPALSILPKISWTVDEKRFRENSVLYTPLALVLFVVMGRFLPVTFIFSVLLFGWILWVIIVIAAYWMFSANSAAERIRWMVFLAIVYFASIPLGLSTGMGGQFLYPAVLIASGYMLATGRAPWKAILAALPVAVFVILPFLSIYKTTPETQISNRLSSAIEQYTSLNILGRTELAAERSIGRFAGAALPSVYSNFYPEVYPFELGRTFLLEAQGLVPRFLWPNKPNLSRELNKYSVNVRILESPDETSVVFDAITEYYVNFGLIGVLCLSVLHGYSLRVLYDWLMQTLPFFMAVSVFCVLFLINLDFFGLFQILFAYVKVLPVWIGILYFLSRKS